MADSPGSSSDAGGTGGAGTSMYISPAAASEAQEPRQAALWSQKRRSEEGDAARLAKRGKGPMMPDLHPDVQLTPTQNEVLAQLVSALDTSSTSVVITNPLLKDNPIVYVTEPWQDMCGFTYDEAVNRNPRLTQGAKSDPGVVKLIAGALGNQRSCKCMMLNYRSGLAERPFFNMLSISPIMHQGKLMLHMANLQDYTYHMEKLIRVTPSQFCRSAEFFQQECRLPPTLDPRRLARPAIFEADADTVLMTRPASGAPAAPLMKRLGWAELDLEPEHLRDRVADALQGMGARYELKESEGDDGLVFVIDAEISGVACRVLVTHDPAAAGSYRITCSRLGGDTFAFHAHFRELRELLGDAVQNGSALGGRSGVGGGRLGGGGGGGLPLGAMPTPCGAEASAAMGSSSQGAAGGAGVRAPAGAIIEEVGPGGAAEAADSGLGRLIS